MKGQKETMLETVQLFFNQTEAAPFSTRIKPFYFLKLRPIATNTNNTTRWYKPSFTFLWAALFFKEIQPCSTTSFLLPQPNHFSLENHNQSTRTYQQSIAQQGTLFFCCLQGSSDVPVGTFLLFLCRFFFQAKRLSKTPHKTAAHYGFFLFLARIPTKTGRYLFLGSV